MPYRVPDCKSWLYFQFHCYKCTLWDGAEDGSPATSARMLIRGISWRPGTTLAIAGIWEPVDGRSLPICLSLFFLCFSNYFKMDEWSPSPLPLPAPADVLSPSSAWLFGLYLYFGGAHSQFSPLWMHTIIIIIIFAWCIPKIVLFSYPDGWLLGYIYNYSLELFCCRMLKR